MIIKIGGCNGSGKTSLMRAIMKQLPFRAEHWKGDSGKVKQYVADLTTVPALLKAGFNQAVVLGDYRNVCGGMDTISDKEVRLGLVSDYCVFNKLNQRTLVLYEGLITGKTYGAMGALSDACRIPWLYVFMDTPFEVCVERVMRRRKAAGNLAPFDPERTMRPTFKSCLSVARKAAENKHTVLMVDHKLEPEDAGDWLLTEAIDFFKKEIKRAS